MPTPPKTRVQNLRTGETAEIIEVDGHKYFSPNLEVENLDILKEIPNDIPKN